MDDIDHNRRLKRQNDEKRYNDIADARKLFLKSFSVTSSEYDSQEKYMKKIQKHFLELSLQPSLTHREFVHVKILNGISPKELFVIKAIDEPHANRFHCDFNRDYDDNKYELVFCLKMGTFCVAKTVSNGWQRCRIQRLHAKNACTAFLLDIGINEHINWIDLRLLDEKWCRQKPFAIRCSLVCIASANPIDRFTAQQHQQFLHALQMYTDFYVLANRPGTISNDIFLYYQLDNNRFDCVNAIFPSGLSSTDDDDDDDDDQIETTLEGKSVPQLTTKRSNSSMTCAGIDRARIAGRTFDYINECSAQQLKSKSNEMSMADENAMKTDHTNNNNNDIEMKDSNGCGEVAPSPQPLQAVVSPVAMSNPLDQQRLSRPETVVIRHIDETGAVYVNFMKYKSALEKLRFEIQKHVKNAIECNSGNDGFAWKVGDYCLVSGRFEGIREWLRGKITYIATAKVDDDNGHFCHVYLRDVGKTIETQLHKLKAIKDESAENSVQSVRDFTFKSQLAFIVIQQNDCSIAKSLKQILRAYDEIAISVLHSDEQLEIILWGIQRNTCALLPEKVELTNVNAELVKRGYASTQISFDRINNLISDLINITPIDAHDYDSDHFQSNLMLQHNYRVTEQQMDVDHWLPSEPIYQLEFAAFPMYVSQKCLLSVLEANRKNIADEMKKILERKYLANELERREALDWKKNDPCFVRFTADGRFYRGSVRRVNFAKNSCMIRFVDYGNCEACEFDDLRKANMFGDIPVLTRLYQLDNIRPLTENRMWPDAVRAFCSEAVVERQCNLVVTDRHSAATKSDNIPTLCKLEIFTKDIDLASALVSRGMADWIRTSSGEP